MINGAVRVLLIAGFVAGFVAWVPFKINITCGECALTTSIIQDTLTNERVGPKTRIVVSVLCQLFVSS